MQSIFTVFRDKWVCCRESALNETAQTLREPKDDSWFVRYRTEYPNSILFVMFFVINAMFLWNEGMCNVLFQLLREMATREFFRIFALHYTQLWVLLLRTLASSYHLMSHKRTGYRNREQLPFSLSCYSSPDWRVKCKLLYQSQAQPLTQHKDKELI